MDYNHFTQPPLHQKTPTSGMESAALTLSIISLVGCSCIYLSIPAGAIAIIVALLSRGGEMTFSERGKLAIALGIAGIIVTICFYTIAFLKAYHEYGSIKGIIDAMASYTGMDYEQFMELLGY